MSSTTTPTKTPSSLEEERLSILDDCLIGNWNEIDPGIPKILKELRNRRSALCWHKHGNFFEHLVGVARICAIWKAPIEVIRCALIHSAYSNSYVNLRLFDGSSEREWVREIVGEETEKLTYEFCTVDRQRLIFEECLSCKDGIIPADGFQGVSRKSVAFFILLTLADFSEQLFHWQDQLFGNSNAHLAFAEHHPGFLWPGIAKPGLFMSRLSDLGRLLATCSDVCPIPPIFQNCTETLSPENEIKARDLYWEVICDHTSLECGPKARELLLETISLNPFVGEPHILLAQTYLRDGEWESASSHATKGLGLLTQWGARSTWDKRVSLGGWVGWARVMQLLATEKRAPANGWEVLSLGMTPAVNPKN